MESRSVLEMLPTHTFGTQIMSVGVSVPCNGVGQWSEVYMGVCCR